MKFCPHCGKSLVEPVQEEIVRKEGKRDLADNIAHGLRRKEIQDMEMGFKFIGWIILSIIGYFILHVVFPPIGWFGFLVPFIYGVTKLGKKYYG